MPSADEWFAVAVRQYETGQLPQAEQTARQVLAQEPHHAGALHLLGGITYQAGHAGAAVDYFRQAALADPANAVYHSSLGAAYQAIGKFAEAEACHQRARELRPGDALVLNNQGIHLVSQGRKDEAVAAFRQALAANPNDAEVVNNLGAALMALGKSDEAISYYERALVLRPDFAQAHNNLGNALQARGQTEAALACYHRAVHVLPQFAQGYKNLGDALQATGKLDAAIRAYRQALQIKPDYAEAHANLGNVLLSKNGNADAQACYEQALHLNPDDADAQNGLGNAFHAQGKLEESEECYRRAAALKPDFSTPRYNLGVTLQAQGQLAAAQECYRQALRMKPDDAVAHSTYLGSLNYTPGIDIATLVAEHRHWPEVHAAGLGRDIAHNNTPDPGRPLRVGYLSPDFRSHAVAFFLEPILYHHDRDRIEPVAYCDVAAPDWETAYLRTLPAQWREIYGLSDERLERLIRRDGIDILVDLTGHTAYNRLLVFARKPAPIQVSYLGYPSTTGLDQIDYRITDAVCDPPGEPICHTEELARLEPVFCTYSPPKNARRPVVPPASRAGSITFGSLHKLEKLNDTVLDLWYRILRDVHASRLLLSRNTMQAKSTERLLSAFEAHGVSRDRIEFRRIEAVRMQHLRLYEEVDISLDPFPWNGHTTACESLWMGVPVVALRGGRHAARMVASVLTCLNLTELVGDTPDDYCRVAVGLAGDLPRLRDLRRSLRTRMFESPLCDGAAFTQGLEDAYRRMWHRWCAQSAGWLAVTR